MGIAFIDSTPLEVGHPARAHAYKVFKHQVGWGKSSTGWKFGFKLHLIINERGELLAFKLTPANTDDRKPLSQMTQDLFGQLFGDRGYISQKLFKELYQRGLQLVTKAKKIIKQHLEKLMDKTCCVSDRSLSQSITHSRTFASLFATCCASCHLLTLS